MSRSDPDVRERILRTDPRVRAGGPELAEVILHEVERMRDERCADPDCVRRRRHSLLGPHAWKHEPEAPLTRVRGLWLCFSCGHRERHRVHRPRQEN